MYKTDNVGVSSSILGKGPAVMSHIVEGSGAIKVRGSGPEERLRLSEMAAVIEQLSVEEVK